MIYNYLQTISISKVLILLPQTGGSPLQDPSELHERLGSPFSV